MFLAAIQCCYQNIRRQWCESQSGKENYVAHQQKQRKYRSRRQRVKNKGKCVIRISIVLLFVQLFEKRSHVVSKNEQKQYWCHLTQAYMTEESDDAEHQNKIIQHRLQWRFDSELKLLGQ